MDMPIPATNFKLTMPLGPRSGITDEARANREIVVGVYQAIIDGDDGAVAGILDPEILFFEAASLPYGVAARGIEQTMAGVAAMLGAWSDITLVVEEALAAGDLVCLYMTFKGVSRATGKSYEGVCAEMFRFKNGKVVEWRPIYWDTHAMRLACGLD